MTTLLLPYSREDAKVIVKAAFELIDDIDSYSDEGPRIIGRQEASVFGGNGAQVTVDIPETETESDSTEISVDAKKNVSIDMATDEEALKSEFIGTIDELREKDISKVERILSETSDSKEVESGSKMTNTQSTMGQKFILYFIIFMLFSLVFGWLMTAAMMP